MEVLLDGFFCGGPPFDVERKVLTMGYFQTLLWRAKQAFSLVILFFVFVFVLNGCASKDEVVRLKYELYSLEGQITSLDNKISRTNEETESKVTAIENKIGGVEKTIRPVKKDQADTNAVLDSMQIRIQSLEGKLEEYQYSLNEQNKESGSLKEGNEFELKLIKEKLSELEKRLLFAEGYFVSERSSTEQRLGQKNPSGKEKVENKKQTTPEDELYNKAYNDFKSGNMESARTEFRKYLHLYPHSENSDNAQYWIGESFYVEKRYREAVLEFEEVMKKYPKENKVPSALLKQGLAFQRLGDETSAKLLLQKVIDSYPGTDQAEIAKKELKKLL